MADKESKILKITFEYEDRTITYEGESAVRAKEALDGQTTFCLVHGVKWPNIPFKEEKKPI